MALIHASGNFDDGDEAAAGADGAGSAAKMPSLLMPMQSLAVAGLVVSIFYSPYFLLSLHQR